MGTGGKALVAATAQRASAADILGFLCAEPAFEHRERLVCPLCQLSVAFAGDPQVKFAARIVVMESGAGVVLNQLQKVDGNAANAAVAGRARLVGIARVAPDGLEVSQAHKGRDLVEDHAVGDAVEARGAHSDAVGGVPEHGVDLLVEQMELLVREMPAVLTEAVQE